MINLQVTYQSIYYLILQLYTTTLKKGLVNNEIPLGFVHVSYLWLWVDLVELKPFINYNILLI